MKHLYLKRKDIDPDKYILIPGTHFFISERELYKGKNLDFEDSHLALEEKNLWMPPAELFMPFVRDVHKVARNEIALMTGEGKTLSEERTKNLSRYLSSDYDGGAFTWLNNAFRKGRGHHGLDVEIRQGRKGKDILLKISPLEKTAKLGYATFTLNQQGFPREKSKYQKDNPRNNFYFFEPVERRVARFVAGSGGAFLDCDGNPTDAVSALGVFACAEGAAR